MKGVTLASHSPTLIDKERVCECSYIYISGCEGLDSLIIIWTAVAKYATLLLAVDSM